MNMIKIACTLIILLFWITETSSVYAQKYLIIDIGTLEGTDSSYATGVNESGQVVGKSYITDGTEKAFIWSDETGIEELPSLGGNSWAWDINDSGVATGYSTDRNGNIRAVRWEKGNGYAIADLETLANGLWSEGRALNNAGVCVGFSEFDMSDFPVWHAFSHDGTTGMHDLGTLTTAWLQWSNGWSKAYDINDSGQIVGSAMDSAFMYHAFIYDMNDSDMVDIGTHPDFPDFGGVATTIDDAGQVGGVAVNGANQDYDEFFPLIWEIDSVTGELSTTATALIMPVSHPFGQINGMNNNGQFVGLMWDQEGNDQAFIYDDESGTRNLNDLIIPPDSGWNLLDARDINDGGEIVGIGTMNGQKRAFKLTIIPDSDEDGILDDGDGSGDPTDNPCTGGNTTNCDDNCMYTPNPDQLDQDSDFVGDACDNCRGVENWDQYDANAGEDDNPVIDGMQHYGNACDPDFNNNGIVDIIDLNMWRQNVGNAVPPAPDVVDINGDGVIWLQDLAVLRAYYGTPPGPGIGDGFN